MENATKALLIAAAVLIAIVLIGLTMTILNSSDTSAQLDSAVSTQESQAFNAQFKAYAGKAKPGSIIPNLLATVNNSNKKNTQHDVAIVMEATSTIFSNAAADLPTESPEDSGIYPQVYGGGSTTVYKIDTNTGSKYDSTAKYDIIVHQSAVNGYIYAIEIK